MAAIEVATPPTQGPNRYPARMVTKKTPGVILAVNHGGDSDSTGLIAGHLLGAMQGRSAIPNRWLAPLELGWKARAQKEEALMADLMPLLRKRAGAREIAGLKAWEETR